MGEYRDPIARDPTFGRALSGMAVLLANPGERDAAEEYFGKALAQMDRMSERERYRTRGAYYLMAGNQPLAIEEYTKLVAEYPADSVGHGNLSLAYFFERSFERALSQGQKALELYPKNLVTRNNVALYAIHAGDFDLAVQDAESVLAVNPSFEKAYLARGRMSSVSTTLARAVRGSRQTDVLFPAARRLLRSRREDEALEIASELGGRLEADPRAYGKLIEGELELERGNSQGAIRLFRESTEISNLWMSRRRRKTALTGTKTADGRAARGHCIFVLGQEMTQV